MSEVNECPNLGPKCDHCDTESLFHDDTLAGRACNARQSVRDLGRALLAEVDRLKAMGVRR